MSVLVVDNIDSFVYNLVQYVGILGEDPIVVQNTESYGKVKKLIKNVDKIIVSPGPKTPLEAGISNRVIKEFHELPILGVCLGHQCIGHVFGAKIRPAKTLMHGKTSMIRHNKKDIFRGIPNPVKATRYHSLVLDEKTLPDCLEVTARSKGDNEIMGIKHKEYPCFGVQFHPESILTKHGLKIIKNFLEV